MVADGVGGWAEVGVDPALFSKQLVLDIQILFNQNKTETLKNILVESVKVNPHTGSSTAVLVKIDPEQNNLIRTTNLGDSGYVHYRFNSESQKMD